jgi:predicted glycoside hydrolase/deacetylase ChbG (UPF0249 family)
LPRLILTAYAQRLDRHAVKQDILRQLAEFERALGRLPDFIDGHQHVHQLPVIREVLFEVLVERDLPRKTWLRATFPPDCRLNAAVKWSARFKARQIGWLGASALSHLVRQHGYRQNHHLLGVYGFDLTERHYLDNLRAWLACSENGDLLMCHPAVPGRWRDPLLSSRNREYAAFASREFLELISHDGLVIGALAQA